MSNETLDHQAKNYSEQLCSPLSVIVLILQDRSSEICDFLTFSCTVTVLVRIMVSRRSMVPEAGSVRPSNAYVSWCFSLESGSPLYLPRSSSSSLVNSIWLSEYNNLVIETAAVNLDTVAPRGGLCRWTMRFMSVRKVLLL